MLDGTVCVALICQEDIVKGNCEEGGFLGKNTMTERLHAVSESRAQMLRRPGNSHNLEIRHIVCL